ncbi:HAD-IA family hydrolase [Glaciimonas sp. CA11.2]|uniref:HAD family hydrolase n=1 Tax=unclassified Glaciimonas TaxID=2644401 RepID=UPI002AB4E512|nr:MULTISPECIES: HAD-IA family hydrolase [unclassified Glaciimonas]MDY7546755.1 HAD-IA family hydrolase [Glaciimonas sp. CA11.2]MEB0011857.1 HAD-IA family hydrolase [Glaciimonas sp. Cout2]MEB0080587.1 HAD-IA family hydrolase [Glaciimonas sp. Gout2]MEB0162539.1 HAD-IA family hydrolase [Glaciimonas sp. CA11.2]
MPLPIPRAILFDLDGTLADTAPDLAAAMNRLQLERGLSTTAYHALRPFASAGARGLIGVAFGLKPGDDGYEDLRVAFLDNYAASLAEKSSLFDGVPALLLDLDQHGLTWGVVTNKAARFTDLLIPQIGLQHAGCVISGDTMAHPKPHPAPLLEAARRLNLAPHECWYVGDDLRDIQAGRAAGMPTVAAAWGYCGHAEPVTWNADALADTPSALMGLIQTSLAQ